MKVIKQTLRNSCMYCVLAMITNETEDYVIDWFKNYGEGVTLTILDANIYLAHHGVFLCTEVFNVDSSVIDAEYISIIKFDGTPLIVTVVSEDFPEFGHTIYWDGAKVHDPNPNTRRSKLSEYEVKNMYPVTTVVCRGIDG